MHLVCQVHNYWCSCLVFADSYNVIYSFSWTIIFFTNSLQPMMDNLFSCTLVQGGKAGGRAKTWCMLFFKNYFLRIIRFKYENRVRPSEGFLAPPQKMNVSNTAFWSNCLGTHPIVRSCKAITQAWSPSSTYNPHNPHLVRKSVPLEFTVGWPTLC